jgi:hypothetical protein
MSGNTWIRAGLATVAVLTIAGCPAQSGSPTPGSGSAPSAGRPETAAPTDEEETATPSQTATTSDGPDAAVAFPPPAKIAFGEGEAFSSRQGFNVEGVGRAVVVTVTGASEVSVQNFVDEAKFGFELAEAEAIQPGGDVQGSDGVDPEEDMPREIDPKDLLDDPASSNLYIEFRLTNRAVAQKPEGVLIATVDPQVPFGAYHNFYVRDPSSVLNDTATVAMTVSTGEASGWLFLNCRYAGWMRRSASNPYGELKASGVGRFDFFVYGRQHATSTYQLKGTWSYSYPAGMPIDTQPRISC